MNKKVNAMILLLLVFMCSLNGKFYAQELKLGKTYKYQDVDFWDYDPMSFWVEDRAVYTVYLSNIVYYAEPDRSGYDDAEEYYSDLDDYKEEAYVEIDTIKTAHLGHKPQQYSFTFEADDEWDGELDIDTGSSIKSYEIKITKNKKIPAKTIKVPKKLTVYLGFSEKVEPTFNNTYKYKLPNMTWKSSNKRVATVNQSGVVKGIKIGKCTITVKTSTKKYSIAVTVKPNAVARKITSDISDWRYGIPGFSLKTASLNGRKLTVKFKVFNNYSRRISKFNWIKVKIYNYYTDKTYAVKLFRNIRGNISAFGTGYVTLTIPNSKVFSLGTESWGYEVKSSCAY